MTPASSTPAPDRSHSSEARSRAPRKRAALNGIAHVVFFASGFAALLYQAVWQRMLAFFGGADVFSVTIIVTAFMAGLGFGSLAGGHVADRIGRRARLLGFAGAELAVGAFGLASPMLLYDVLFLELSSLGASPVLMPLVLFAVLLWPTFFMGMSLPLLSRALAAGAAPGRLVATLYGWNTLGAACGSVLTAWVLFRVMNFRAILALGAGLSLACAVVGGVLAWCASERSEGSSAARKEDSTSGAPLQRPSLFALPTWLAIYALSGFIALSLEILWFRVVGVFIKSNSFTFGTLLAVYLGGLGLGTLIAGRAAATTRAPAHAFLRLQAAVPAVAALSLILLVHLVGGDEPSTLRDHLAGYEPLDVRHGLEQLGLLAGGQSLDQSGARALRLVLALYVLVPIVAIVPATVLMGMSFSYLQSAVQTDVRMLGRRVGWLQTANIVGSMLGAALTGLLSLHWLGSSGTFCLLVLLGAFFLVAERGGTRGSRSGLLPVTGLAVLLVGAFASLPDAVKLWARLHGSHRTEILAREDRSGVSALVQRGAETVVYANGLGQSSLPFGGFGGIHTVLGALPAMVHPAPEAIAVIGLGSGDTLFGVGGRPETKAIHSIEIIAPALETLRLLAGRHEDPGLRSLLRDARITHHFTDGRAFLLHGDGRYDIIEADALRPNSAYAGNLYSVEYFELLRRRLKPGGLAVSWAATDRVRDTFIKVFPHVVLTPGILIGSSTPIAFDTETIRRRLRVPFTHRYYESARLDIEEMMAPHLAAHERFDPAFDRARLGDENRDLRPRDEFMVPRARVEP